LHRLSAGQYHALESEVDWKVQRFGSLNKAGAVVHAASGKRWPAVGSCSCSVAFASARTAARCRRTVAHPFYCRAVKAKAVAMCWQCL
jgi:hypothetical protein